MKKLTGLLVFAVLNFGSVSAFSAEVKCKEGERKNYHISTFQNSYYADVHIVSDIAIATKKVLLLCESKGRSAFYCIYDLKQEIQCEKIEKDEE